MTLDEVKNTITKLQEMKQGNAYLSMPAPRSIGKGRFPQRVRTPFGLCKWYPSSEPGAIFIYPTVEQLEKFMAKQPESEGQWKR